MNEDAHLCLRCRATIIGLDHYVAHRQAGCATDTTRQAKLHPEASAADRNMKTYTKKHLQETQGSKSPATPFSDNTHPVNHDSDRGTADERSDSTTTSRQPETVSKVKYRSSESAIRDCYVEQAGQASEDSGRAVADASSLHEPYAVIEDFTAALPQPHSEASMSASHTELKHKSQESLGLSHRPSSSQAPFTGYKDPLLLHGHDAPSILRHFDSFSDHQKIPHEGESESHSETMALFKVSSSSYELESQNFESRYSDFYSIQPTPQEPLLTNVSSLEQSKTKEVTQGDIKLSDNTENQSPKAEEITKEDTYEKGDQEEREEFPNSSLKFSESGTTDDVQVKPDLRQDDFLSSLELRSSVKVPAKRRHEEEDELDEDEDDETRPPRHHTGGKWRPGSRPPPSVGGKWRPSTPKTEFEEDEDEEMEEDYTEEEEGSLMPPPPTYTKGKWLPGKKMTNIIKVGSTVEYHCQACSRVLKGKEAYERHLKSQLHFVNENKASGKRKPKVSKEIPPITESTRPVRSKKLQAQNFLKSTIAHLKSRKIGTHNATSVKQTTNRTLTWKGVTGAFPNITKTQSSTEEEAQQVDEEEEIHKRSSGTPKMLCPICKLSFGEAYAALHFASLAHIHNELEERHNKSKEIDSSFDKLIIQNIAAIVKTSPFFCEGCKFYCNLHEDFLAHMKTHTNDPEDDVVKTMFSCSACSDEDPMQLPAILHHLQTPHHADNVRDLVLQAQQVVLSSRTLVVCPLGDGTFRYQRQYQTHRRIHHQEPGFQLPNHRVLRCSQCNFKALRKHQIRAHMKVHEVSQGINDSYHCFVCGLSFSTPRQAEVHRRSAEHRTTLWRQRGVSVTRICNLCYEEVDDLPTLRQHMSQTHQKDCTPCHLCGIVPPLRSDHAKHQRECDGVPGDLEGKHKCDLCPFKNDLLAHVLTHKILAHCERETDSRYACHICKTKLQPASVKGHMLSHTNEWPHACHICSRKFLHQDWLEKHLSAVHTCGAHVHSAQSPALCDTCGKTFSNRWHLYRHQLDAHAKASPSVLSKTDPETPDSPQPATKDSCRPPSQRLPKTKEPPARSFLCDVCGVKCQTLTSLKTHRQSHKRGEGDKYECPHCNYATSHLPHLRRHLRLHTGSTPYSCPYCTYVCNNQENLRKHMLKTKRHPGRFMYECRLCMPPHDQPGKDSDAKSSQSLNLDSTSPQTTDSSAFHSREPELSTSESHDPGGSFSHQLNPEPSSSPTQGPQHPQTQTYEASNLRDVGECHPPGPEASPSRDGSVYSNIDSTDVKTESSHIFCSNYATQFHVHLLEKHKEAFQTKEEITLHIRSYYHAEQDTTVTTDPLPFVHKKRSSEPQPSRPSGTAPASYSSRAARARRRPERVPIKAETGDPDDPTTEGTRQANEDVLSQLRRSLHIEEFGCDNKAASDAQNKEMDVRQSEETEDEENSGAGKDGIHHGQEDKSAGCSASLSEADARGDSRGASSCARRPPPSLRAPSRPSILRSSTPQGEAAQSLRIMIQQLQGDTTVEVDDDGTQQVIIILPDKLGEQPGNVATLLPSLGLASSPDGCGSLSMVQQHKDLEQQPLAAKDAAGGAVIMQTDQMIALDTQVVTDPTIISDEADVVDQQHTPVMLCSQQQPQQRQHKQVLHSAQVFNPLQVVAEAAEALTQNELVTRESHQILTTPHQVLSHTPPSQDVLTEPPASRPSQLLDTAMFEASEVRHPEVTHAAEGHTVLPPRATLSFVDEQVTQRNQGKPPEEGEIIYSFTLQ